MSSVRAPSVGLFITCLADIFRPQVGFAAVRLLEQAGCRVAVPQGQTCCGQPAVNAGDRAGSAAMARRLIETFDGLDYVVAPSGSCVATLRRYPELFGAGDPWRARAEALKPRAFELTMFLVDVLGFDGIQSACSTTVAYHDSCAGLRELGIKTQPRRLVDRVRGLTRVEMDEAEACCGFGGTFCVKYPEISTRMVETKCERILATGADTVLGGDLGCLLNIAGKLKRLGVAVQTRHVAEVLAGMSDEPPIGEGK